MKAIKFLALTSFVLTSFNCFGDDGAKLFGIESASIIAESVSVKACRTVGSRTLSPPEYFEKARDSLNVSTNLARRLSQVLLNEKSYEFSNSSTGSCVLQPIVAITYSDGKRDVDVYFCFDCTVLVVKSQTKEVGNRFGPSRAELVQIIKEIFPDDSQIQSLKE